MATQLEYSQHAFLAELGIEAENLGVFNGEKWCGSGPVITSMNPSTGNPIARIKGATPEEYESCMTNMLAAQAEWQMTPAPKRGDIVRQIGDEIRKFKNQLGALVSLEMGKIIGEGVGEVQEFIDICDFATGISRTIAGQVLPSERANHTLLEVWNPLGVVGIISAFNFPMAVLSWNAAISLICGNVNIWKGASSTSLCTLAVTKIMERVFRANGVNPAVMTTVIGSGATIGERLIQDKRISLVSFTGSTSIGRGIATTVHSRFGTTILELGGNNALIVMDDASLDLVIPAAFFGAIGTCGQRCTSTRRMLVHEKVYDEVVARMLKAYGQIRIGNPLDANTLCGPLHTQAAVKEFTDGIETIKAQGGKILAGGSKRDGPGNFVNPTLVEIHHDAPIVREELFVPITYVIKFSTFEEAVAINNEVPQGLSSSLFTTNMQNVFRWVGPLGSDCGIINVNAGTSGAEIGGAFGGQKETGGGRESGSDSWKQYMRRGTVTVNYGKQLPLSQGLKFGTD